MASTRLATLAALALLLGAARADVPDALRQGDEALARRQLEAAEAAFRSAYDAADATAEQRRRAFDGLLGASLERGRAAELAAALEQRLAAATAEQRPALLDDIVRSQKARDGHLFGALAFLEGEAAGKGGHAATRLLKAIRSACSGATHSTERLGSELISSLERASRRVATPRRPAKSRSLQPPGLPAPRSLEYEVRLARIAPPARPRTKGIVRPVSVGAPPHLHTRAGAPVSVAKPPVRPRPSSARLAVAFFSQVYQRATELAGQGLTESAKAEYAALIHLFPGTSQAHQAARYALQLFKRGRGAGQRDEALAAYLQWVRAVVGPEGDEYAEHLAFSELSNDADPMVVAREAEGFLKRHPDSKWAPSIRLQLAVALDRTGATARAIEALKPLASALDDTTRVRAARVLAWLHIFQGEAAPARQVLEAIAGQALDVDAAADARRLLEAMAAYPLPKLAIAEVVGGDDPDEALAARLLDAGDQMMRKGDPERAMDLYSLYLTMAAESPGYFAAKTRIETLKRTGRLEEE